MRTRRRTSKPHARLLLAICTLTLAAATVPASGAAARPARRPNILLIVADDQHRSTFTRTYMPSVFARLVDRGVRFDRAYVSSSVCCPSRAEILTGLLEHHTGVDDNGTRLTKPTIVEALQDLGYRTMLSGKYLNSAPCDPRPEFDRWVCQHHFPPSGTTLTDPTLNVDGRWVTFRGYTTEITADHVTSFIRSTPTHRPFFVLYSPTSPRLGGGDDRYRGMSVPRHRPPSYDENTLESGKPFYMQRGALTTAEKRQLDGWHRKGAQAVRGFDDSIGRILGALGPRAAETIVVYINDNGFLLGEHRRVAKMVPYEGSTHVPFVVRYPPLVPRADAFRSRALVMNIDVAATLMDLVDLRWRADGRSLVPLLAGKRTSIRRGALLTWCRGVHSCPGNRMSSAFVIPQKSIPSYWAIATVRYKYVEYRTGERELYDLRTDPHELSNLAGRRAFADVEGRLSERLARLHDPVRPDTTIVSGPRGLVRGSSFTFRYFSQSRFATYRCRLDRNGERGAWRRCDGERLTVGPLSPAEYVFRVAGTDERGVMDRTPARRAFRVS
jgi:N-acetylglucosamine-6-sulfatase